MSINEYKLSFLDVLNGENRKEEREAGDTYTITRRFARDGVQQYTATAVQNGVPRPRYTTRTMTLYDAVYDGRFWCAREPVGR